jgi:hypothetical protein
MNLFSAGYKRLASFSIPADSLRRHVALQPRTADAILHFVQRPTRDFEISGEFGVRCAPEAFRNIPADRVDGVFSLRPVSKITAEWLTPCQLEGLTAQGVSKLPAYELREMTSTRHDARGSIGGAKRFIWSSRRWCWG